MTDLLLQIVIAPSGEGHCVYGEAIELCALGAVRIRRASVVEPDATGRWSADLSAVGGPRLGPYPRRSDALAAEGRWLADHWLSPPVRAERIVPVVAAGRQEVP